MSEDVDLYDSDFWGNNQYGACVSPRQPALELRRVSSTIAETKSEMTEIAHCGSGEANVKCSDSESVERSTLLDTLTKNLNCESLGINATEFDCQNRDNEQLGQIISPNYMSIDSNQEQKRSELEDCRENSKIEQMEFPSGNEATSSTVEYSTEPQKELPAEYVSTGSNNEQKIPSLVVGGQNSKIEDDVGTSCKIESSIEPPKELPTGHIFTDSNLEQKNLPLNNCGLNSNLLPSNNKETNYPVKYSAEPPSDMIENLGSEQLNETQKGAVENPSQPLEQRSENDEKQSEVMIVEPVCKEPLLHPGDFSVNPSLEQKGSAPEDLTANSSFKNLELVHENEEAVDHSAEVPGDTSENPDPDLRKTHIDSNENPSQLECGDKRPTGHSRKRKSTLRSPISSTRVLRSRTQEKPKPFEPINASADDSANNEKKRKRRKSKKGKQIAVNEFSGIKSHLRYLLHRIKNEQNLIDAYSGEGWKGQSLEKIKPEKELQRAKSVIFQYKLKIRDLFQRIDTSLSQGRLPESLFDSEGEIDSEDIFCAKCGNKDLPADNDIILCDGVCERGFHQLCLLPPLLKEDIPAGEEGWLCPGCDCKVDCIDLLNDLQGTDLSVTDSWEEVFPEEAAAAASGKQLDDIAGLPSDDSEDDDYNPDNMEVEENVSRDESSSDEEDSSDTSFELETTPNDEQLLGLPSEDSEDDDYDPDAPECAEQVMQESSSSEFTSDSEDFGVVFENNTSPGQDQRKKNKVDGAKRHSLKDEVSYLLHSNAALASGKRHVERLDYKKLHDETYGTVSSDSSDEDYGGSSASKRRKKRSDKAAVKSSDQTPVDAMGKNVNQNENEHTANKRACKNFKAKGSVASESGSSSKRNSKPKYGEDAIKRLYESFNETKYPKREVKESLATELGLTLRQVDKWFANTRWSFFHPSTPRKGSIESEKPSKSRISSPQTKKATPDVEDVRPLQSTTNKETGGQKHITPESKTITNGDHQASNGSSRSQKSKKHNTQAGIKNCQQARRSKR